MALKYETEKFNQAKAEINKKENDWSNKLTDGKNKYDDVKKDGE